MGWCYGTRYMVGIIPVLLLLQRFTPAIEDARNVFELVAGAIT
jgi:hypothetical protein